MTEKFLKNQVWTESSLHCIRDSNLIEVGIGQLKWDLKTNNSWDDNDIISYSHEAPNQVLPNERFFSSFRCFTRYFTLKLHIGLKERTPVKFRDFMSWFPTYWVAYLPSAQKNISILIVQVWCKKMDEGHDTTAFTSISNGNQRFASHTQYSQK